MFTISFKCFANLILAFLFSFLAGTSLFLPGLSLTALDENVLPEKRYIYRFEVGSSTLHPHTPSHASQEFLRNTVPLQLSCLAASSHRTLWIDRRTVRARTMWLPCPVFLLRSNGHPFYYCWLRHTHACTASISCHFLDTLSIDCTLSTTFASSQSGHTWWMGC